MLTIRPVMRLPRGAALALRTMVCAALLLPALDRDLQAGQAASAAPAATAAPPTQASPATDTAPAAAPPPGASAPEEDPTHLKTITVEAQRRRQEVQHQVETFVSAITIRPWKESLVRWNTRICPLVAGFSRDKAEFILERLTQIASAAGAPLATEKCQGNFLVIASANPDALLKAWSKHDARLFGNAPQPQINRFMTSTRPIRVWYNADLDTSGGMSLAADASSVGLGNGSVGGGANTQAFAGISTNTHAHLSRLQFDEVQNVSTAFVVIDLKRIQGINFGQLADYVAMVGLTEINLDAVVEQSPSILKLFAAPEDTRPAGLSAWDQAFLKAMYRTDQTDKMQISAIETQIVKDLVP